MIHEVGFIIVREDQKHKLWIDPRTIISRARYEINEVEITLHQGKIIYVDDDGIGLNNGSSWENAYIFLQDALADARIVEKPVEIRVAQGIYTPDEDSISPEGTGDRKATFHLIKNVTIKGGYAGLGELDPNARDIEFYQTILSGDLNGNDVEVNDPCDLFYEPTRAENSYIIVTGNNINETAILDGFIITAGNANGTSTYSNGGGIVNYYMSSPTLTNCILRRNFASFGGGIACGEFSSPEITNCSIKENLATWSGGGIGCGRDSSPIISNCLINSNTSMRYGGGIFTINSNAIIIDCTISENQASSYGGGIFCEYMTPTISNCLITANVADIGGGGINCLVSNPVITNCIISYNKAIRTHGGGIICDRSSPSILNCLITANESAVDGGGIHCFSNIDGQSSPTVTSCTIADNFAERGGGGICCENSSTLTAINCIVWENSASHDLQLFRRNTAANLLLSNCNVQGGWPGEGNIDVDPLFGDPIKGDYHLKSQAGRWNPDSGNWIFDYTTSPCIDAGDPNIPVGNESEPNGGRINMGAYGGSPEASKSYILSKIIYVDDDAEGLNDGSSWQNAYIFLRDALADANSVEKPVEIRVAQGIYKPDEGNNGRPGDQRASFCLINKVAIKGGFAGLGEPDPNARNIVAYETILSGDLNSDNIDIYDPGNLYSVPNRYDNSEIVVIGNDTDASAVLDGLTITGGYISVIPYRLGGGPIGGAGVLISSGSPTLINCMFTDNVTSNTGGGLLIYGDSNPTLSNCKFMRNYAESGGGIFSTANNSLILVNCTFSDNYALHKGGGMFNFNGNLKLTNCSFSRNSGTTGGGMYNKNSNSELTNCTFSENSATAAGGGMYNQDSNTALNMCEFVRNTDLWYSGAISNGGGQLIAKGCVFKENYPGAVEDGIENDTIFTECIFSGNSSSRSGGAVRVFEATFNHCIFAGNRALGAWNTGGAVFSFVTAAFNNCTFSNNWAESRQAIDCSYLASMKNCIFWGTDDQIRANPVQYPSVDYSDIQGGWTWPGEGNIDADPCFANPGHWADADDLNVAAEPDDPNAVWVEGDYHLKSQAGRWDPASQSWVVDDVTSPCIDAGDPNMSVGDEQEPNGGRINMGAYGGTPKASLSPLIGRASNPNPPDGAIGVSPNVILSWSPGENAIAHDVYFGMYLNSDINATRENPLGLLVSQGQDANFYDPGQLRPQGMLYTQERCYWRIDEIDSQGNITTGDVWKFQVHEYKGRLCFTGQTPVWINYSFTPISKVDIGKSIDGINRIEEVQEHEGTYTLYDILLESGNSITVAENHIFMIENGNWLSLHKLKAGTRLKTLRGSIGIKSVTKQPSPFTGKVYNLKIQGSDQYIVGQDMIIVRDY
jgi:parallel beta-helix repeat protein/predicted outer membrane repeat protein